MSSPRPPAGTATKGRERRGALPAPAAAIPARRGDLVVIQQHHRSCVIGAADSEYDTFTVGVVTSISREGNVRRYRRAGQLAAGQTGAGRGTGGDLPRTGLVQALVMDGKKIDVQGALATAACHVWATPAGGAQTKPYSSLTEVRNALRPHLITGRLRGWERLRGAAGAWETARREAQPLLAAALGGDREDFAAISAAYEAAVRAANDTYRAVYREVTS